MDELIKELSTRAHKAIEENVLQRNELRSVLGVINFAIRYGHGYWRNCTNYRQCVGEYAILRRHSELTSAAASNIGVGQYTEDCGWRTVYGSLSSYVCDLVLQRWIPGEEDPAEEPQAEYINGIEVTGCV